MNRLGIAHRRPLRRRSAGLLACGLLVLLGASLRAGEPKAPLPPAPGPGPAPAAAPGAPPAGGLAGQGVEKAKGEKFIDPEAKPWVYEDKNLRDPFTFVKINVKPVESKEGDVPVDMIAETQMKAEQNLAAARQAFKFGRFKKSLEYCDRGLEAFAQSKAGLDELNDLQKSLRRLRAAAERQHKRKEAEQAFRGLNLRVTGIIAKRRNSLAIVNNRVLGRGELIESSDQSDGAIIDEILPGRVIVLFRGYRMEVGLSH